MLKKLEDIDNIPEMLEIAKNMYKYQRELTEELDANSNEFTEIHFLKIVLWKLNRYPEIKDETIRMLNELKKSYSAQKALMFKPWLFLILPLSGRLYF